MRSAEDHDSRVSSPSSPLFNQRADNVEARGTLLSVTPRARWELQLRRGPGLSTMDRSELNQYFSGPLIGFRGPWVQVGQKATAWHHRGEMQRVETPSEMKMTQEDGNFSTE